MYNQRLKAIEAGQSSIARKVLACVPIQDAWTVAQIVREVARCGSAPDMHIVDGCINSLRDSGLVKEVRRGVFQRVAPKDEPEQPTASSEPDSSPAPALKLVASSPIDPLQRFAEISTSLRRLADDIDENALAMAAAIEQERASSAKFRQLQALLKAVE